MCLVVLCYLICNEEFSHTRERQRETERDREKRERRERGIERERETETHRERERESPNYIQYIANHQNYKVGETGFFYSEVYFDGILYPFGSPRYRPFQEAAVT